MSLQTDFQMETEGENKMERKHAVGFAVLEIAYWCFHAAFGGFISAYLLEHGMTSSALSLISAAYLLCSFAGSFVFGGLCDRLQTNRKVFIAGVFLTAALACGIFFGVGSVPAIAVLYPLFGFVSQPMGSNMDAWLLHACKKDMRIYGKIRATPSMLYSFVAMLFGRLIAAFGYLCMLFGGAFFLALTLAAASVLPDTTGMERTKRIVRAGDVRSLLAQPDYRTLILILFFIGCAGAPMKSLKAVIIENLGGTVSDIGMDSFVGALTQVPFILLSGTILRLGRKARYVLMSALTGISILLTLCASSVGMIFAGSFFANASYGVLLATMRETTETSVRPELRNLGHNLSDAVYTSFSGAITLTYAGAIAEHAGVSCMLMVSTAIALVPVVSSLLYKDRRDPAAIQG